MTPDLAALLHRADLWLHAQIPSENPAHIIGALKAAIESLAAENAEQAERFAWAQAAKDAAREACADWKQRAERAEAERDALMLR